MMKGSRQRKPSHFCFSLHKIASRNLPSSKSACFIWWILIMESLILIILVIIPGVWSGDWGVTFNSQCALKGTSVVIKCRYDYPLHHIVKSVTWSKALPVSGGWRLFPVSNLSSNPDHFKYVGDFHHDCSLEINDVQPTDRGAYLFSFVTTFNRWTSKTYARFWVTELTTVVQPSTVTEGDNVRLTCVSGCPTPADIVWFRDGQPVPNPVFQARREDAGSYYCAILGQERARSASVALNVQYAPKEVTLSLSPSGDVVKGGSVTFTCSSDANPPVTESGHGLFKDGHFIASGQNHTISDVQPSHSGLYYCQASNNISRRGIDLINSTEVRLDVQCSQSLPILAGIGVSLFVTLSVFALLLFWRKKRTNAEKKQTVFDFKLSGKDSSSSATEDQSNGVYVNIHALPPSPPPGPDVATHSQRNSQHEHDARTSSEDDVTYSTVTIKPRNPSLPHATNNSRALQDSWSKAGENDSVIYATVAKST